MTLKLINIGKRIKNNWIIRHLDLDINNGECLAILGPSGCGKSSTLRLIAGLDKPNEGKILIDNNDVTNISPVKRRVGMVFQSYALFPHLSVYSNLSLGLKVRGVSIKEQKNRISSILSIMQLEELSGRLPSELSGGQRQRVALARALLRDPVVYLLDEPMSNLDAQLREELRPELRRLVLNGSRPTIYVTHDQQEAMAIADRIAVLNNGKLEQIGTPQELYIRPNSLFVATFIGRPQINLMPEKHGIIRGIRPDDIYFTESGLSSKVIHREWFGTNQIIFIENSLGSLKMTCESSIEINENVHVGWKQKDEHHFDASSGIRLIN
ncbi:ABC transporter ATP-binding protein [Prochlorococcus sp. MIT 1307]|uniref:ABC transporter ATP-binding protein n=1 Tax=Prochlorococcus sp. MIT 1307 TaxID=3096219 RepID=UPI002A762455|nr:ABC transporter ATP-binding protein [Prochlorococcus sp. MIT 1307]